MAIKYGTLTEDLPAAPCGYVVPEDIGKLKKAGALLWEACNETSDPIEVIVWDATKAEPKEHIPLPLERNGVTSEVKDIVRQIHNEVMSWLIHCALNADFIRRNPPGPESLPTLKPFIRVEPHPMPVLRTPISQPCCSSIAKFEPLDIIFSIIYSKQRRHNPTSAWSI